MASDLSYTVSNASTSFSEQCSSIDISRLFELTTTVAKLLGRSSAFTATPFKRLSMNPYTNMTNHRSIGDKIGAGGR